MRGVSGGLGLLETSRRPRSRSCMLRGLEGRGLGGGLGVGAWQKVPITRLVPIGELKRVTAVALLLFLGKLSAHT
jgi:hypothetical protein